MIGGKCTAGPARRTGGWEERKNNQQFYLCFDQFAVFNIVLSNQNLLIADI